MSPLNSRCAPGWMRSLGEHDAPGLFEPEVPPPPLAALRAGEPRSLSPLDALSAVAPAARSRALRPELARAEHHVCALDSPCP